jgi:hypothetical protein
MRKKIIYIGLLQAFLLINVRLSLAQNSISKANETVIINASQQVVENYTRYLELLASESDAELLDVYKAELLKSVEKDSISNDLIPPKRRPAERDQNIDPLTTYFDDISSRYREGLKMVFSNFKTSKIYNDKERQRFFVKVSADRVIDGTYFYKNEKEAVNYNETIDFYVSIQLQENGLPVSKIYSVFLHEDNLQSFEEVKVVEKSIPIIIEDLDRNQVFKKGKEYELKWDGGEVYERLSLNLYQLGKRGKIATIDSTFFNNNRQRFTIPKSVKVGSNYYFEIKKLDSEEEPFKSRYFKVKRRIPVVATIGVPVAITTLIVYLIVAQPEAAAVEPDLPESPLIENN